MKKGIFVVTNRSLIKQGNLEDIAFESAEGGASAIILREKDLSTDNLITLAKKIKDKLNGSMPLIINGDYVAAKVVKAEGLHLSFEKFMDFNEEFQGTVGVSIHSLEEAVEAERKGADYILAGHIFETSCKAGLKGRGLEFLKKICTNVTIPVIAIGGISEENINSIMKCGAYGGAVMSSVMESEKPKEYISLLKSKIQTN